MREDTFTCKCRISSRSPVSELSSVLARTCNLQIKIPHTHNTFSICDENLSTVGYDVDVEHPILRTYKLNLNKIK